MQAGHPSVLVLYPIISVHLPWQEMVTMSWQWRRRWLYVGEIAYHLTLALIVASLAHPDTTRPSQLAGRSMQTCSLTFLPWWKGFGASTRTGTRTSRLCFASLCLEMTTLRTWGKFLNENLSLPSSLLSAFPPFPLGLLLGSGLRRPFQGSSRLNRRWYQCSVYCKTHFTCMA